MLVKLSATISGTRNGAYWPPAGSVVDLPADEAQALIAGRLAAPEAAPVADDPPATEVADEAPDGEVTDAAPVAPRKTRASKKAAR